MRSLVVGTTVATNAVLQRRGARVLFVTTAGFEDVPFIGRLDKEELYNLHWKKPDPIVSRRDCFGIAERVAHDGSILVPLTDIGARRSGRLRRVAARTRRRPGGRRLPALLLSRCQRTSSASRRGCSEAFPGLSVSVSHEVSPTWREYERGSTTIGDAYIKPVLRAYVAGVQTTLGHLGIAAPASMLKSNGGHLRVDCRRRAAIAVPHLGSGRRYRRCPPLRPAGRGRARLLARHGRHQRRHRHDPGWAGALSERVPGRVRHSDLRDLRRRRDAWALVAAASPGSTRAACSRWGRAAPAPTRVRCATARVGQNRPRPTPISCSAGSTPLLPRWPDCPRSRRSRAALGGDRATRWARSRGDAVETAAHAIVETANENMANQIKLISVDRGLDPREFVLIPFGGAGPVHASACARLLGIERVLIPPHPGLELRLWRARRQSGASTVSGRSSAARRTSTLRALPSAWKRSPTTAVRELRDDGFDGEPVLSAQHRHALRRSELRARSLAAARSIHSRRRRGDGRPLRPCSRRVLRILSGRRAGRVRQSARQRDWPVELGDGTRRRRPRNWRRDPVAARARSSFRGHGYLDTPSIDEQHLPAGFTLVGSSDRRRARLDNGAAPGDDALTVRAGWLARAARRLMRIANDRRRCRRRAHDNRHGHAQHHPQRADQHRLRDGAGDAEDVLLDDLQRGTRLHDRAARPPRRPDRREELHARR